MERPKITNYTGSSLDLGESFQDDLISIDGEDGEVTRALTFRSYLTLPIKHEAQILAVIFVGSTRPFSFSGSTLTLLERYSHSVGDLIATLEKLGQLQNLDNLPVAVLENAKPYSHLRERERIRKPLRNINRMLMRGVKHAKPFVTSE